jgi:hypothetical protein
MSKKKPAAAEGASPPTRIIIRARNPMEWKDLLMTAAANHWRTLRVEIKIRDRLLAGKPASLDAANAMLKARGLDDFVAHAEDIVDPEEKAAAAASIATDEGLCEFSRRAGRDGVWIPSNNIKAGIKENWSVLGLRVDVRGSRGALAEGIFVSGPGGGDESDWILVGEKPAGVMTGVAHTTGPKGPMSSIKRNEYVERPLITFDIMIANAKAVADKISDDEIAKTLIHFGEHGLGACRSQGFGRFDVVSVSEVAAS